MNVALEIQEYLKAHKIRQAEIAEKCGWTKQRTSAMIRGQQKMAAEDMAAICEALEVPYDFFYNLASEQDAG